MIYILLGFSYCSLGIFLFVNYHPQPEDSKNNGKASSPKRDFYQLYKDLTPVFIAIPTAFLVYSFQRRSSYLQALRDLWKSLIPAVQRAVQYTFLVAPDAKEFAEVQKELAIMVDALRGVFKNISMPGHKKGLYPFEPLKDIQRTVSWLHYRGYSEKNRKLARKAIVQLWNQVHSALLLEFDREVPITPVSKFLTGEPSVADQLIKGTSTTDELKHSPLPIVATS